MPQYFIYVLLIGWMGWAHPFYISLTDIRYNSKNKSIEIAQKIFWDDLEEVLSGKTGSQLDFLNPEDPENLHQIIENYLLSVNEITINGQLVTLTYLGYELDQDAAWFYFEGIEVPIPRDVNIKNSLFLERFDSQQNIVNFYVNNKPKSLITHKKMHSGRLLF